MQALKLLRQQAVLRLRSPAIGVVDDDRVNHAGADGVERIVGLIDHSHPLDRRCERQQEVGVSFIRRLHRLATLLPHQAAHCCLELTISAQEWGAEEVQKQMKKFNH